MTQVKKTLIDGNSIGYAASQSGAVLKAGDMETQAVFVSLKVIRDIVNRNSGGQFLVLWDGRSWRKSEFSEYKAQRGATAKDRQMRSSYKTQSPYLRRALGALGISQAIASNMEADDLAAKITERAAARDNTKIWLVTRDRDWQQLVRENVVWLDHRDQSRVSAKNFAEKTGHADRFQFSQAKALQGDASDNIPGVGQIGEGRAKILLSTWGSVDAFLNDPDPEQTLGKKLPKYFSDFRTLPERQEIYKRNLRLMDLTNPRALPKTENLRSVKGKYDEDAFKDVCAELGFHSYLKDLERFTAPFRMIE